MGVLCFFVLVAGSISGTYFATVSPVLAEIVGLQGLLSALSVNWLFLVAPTLVAEPIALVMRDENSPSSAYLPVELFAGFMYIGAAMCLWTVRAWKFGQLNRDDEQAGVQLGDDWNQQNLSHFKQNGTAGFGRIVQGLFAVKKL